MSKTLAMGSRMPWVKKSDINDNSTKKIRMDRCKRYKPIIGFGVTYYMDLYIAINNDKGCNFASNKVIYAL